MFNMIIGIIVIAATLSTLLACAGWYFNKQVLIKIACIVLTLTIAGTLFFMGGAIFMRGFSQEVIC